jgi:hypothetical protein
MESVDIVRVRDRQRHRTLVNQWQSCHMRVMKNIILCKDAENNCVIDLVDPYGIPIYPLEPEPHATMYGSRSPQFPRMHEHIV